MIPERRKHQQEENVDSWLMSYADMITLLLCFFIVFVSVSEPKKDQISALTEGMEHRFGLIGMTTPYQGLMHSLETVTQTHSMLRDVGVEMTSSGVKMELASGTFFKLGTAEFLPDKLPVLKDIAATIKSMDYLNYQITVEGHTSDIQTTSTLYPSNWELSAARAARVVRYLIDQGIPAARLRAIGYGGSMPEVSNLDEKGQAIPENRTRNERMVIRIEQEK